MLSKGSDFLLGLFYSDEETLVYDNIKLSHSLSKEVIQELKAMSLKFLGPLFMTSDLIKQKEWKIDYIETTLSPQTEQKLDETLMQSFNCQYYYILDFNEKAGSSDHISDGFLIIYLSVSC